MVNDEYEKISYSAFFACGRGLRRLLDSQLLISGTSIQPDVKTVTINYFEYKALKVNPNLSNDLTEAMRDKFRKLTKLEQVEMDGDLELQGR